MTKENKPAPMNVVEELKKGDPFGYKALMASKGDSDLIEAFNSEVGKGGWGTARSHYLAAIQTEFEKRFDSSAIVDKERFSLGNKVKLVGKRIEIIGTKRAGPAVIRIR